MAPLPPTRRQKVVRRLPRRVRHYWKLLVACVAFVGVLAVVLGTVSVRPYVTSASDEGADAVTQNVAGTKDLFDAGVAHSIQLSFTQAAYDKMLDQYFQDGEKEYVEADLTIDGTRLPSVGIRLKGNSTLGGLTRDGKAATRGPGGFGGENRPGRDAQPPGGGFPQNGQLPEGFTPPDGAQQPGAAQPGQQQPGAAQPGQQPGGGFGRTALKAEEPEKLPWLIRVDEFVEGRRYQGHRDLAVRVSGMGGGTTVLNEAVSLQVLAAAGEVAQKYAYTSFTVNDRPTTARLVVEHPDENFADQMDGTGVLYKSLATGRFTDQGDDQTDYQDDFQQITKKGSQDLQPVIDLIRWVTTSSDKEFDAKLDEHVDVESFARYLAVQNLLLNFDDMSGPGRNYYLWYDLSTKKFSVVGWDYNLTMSGDGTSGPHDSVSMGFGGDRPQGQQQGAQQPPAGMQLPEGVEMPGGNGGPGGLGGGHTLKERFLASAAFDEVYETAYRELYTKIYGSGSALSAVKNIVAVLRTVDGGDSGTLASESSQLEDLITRRTSSLAQDEVITQR